MSDYKQGMGKRIKAKRRQLMLTQETVAEALNISVKHMSEVERGLAGLSVENLIRLSEMLGVSLDYLIKGESESALCGNMDISLNALPEKQRELILELVNIGIKLSE